MTKPALSKLSRRMGENESGMTPSLSDCYANIKATKSAEHGFRLVRHFWQKHGSSL